MMGSRTKAFVALLPLSLLFAASGALANTFLYAFTPYHSQQLILNGGSVVLSATDKGWYDNTGFHQAGNPNYAVGQCQNCGPGVSAFRDYFVFDLSGVSGPITDATLSIGNPPNGFHVLKVSNPSAGYDVGPPALWTLYDVSTPIGSLTADQTSATSIFTDLGTGVSFGSKLVTGALNAMQVMLSLNASGLAALNAAVGGQFAVGGKLSHTAGEVPEPATWTMMILGAGAVGAAVRRRRSAQALR
jgi:hypothetical protein